VQDCVLRQLIYFQLLTPASELGHYDERTKCVPETRSPRRLVPTGSQSQYDQQSDVLLTSPTYRYYESVQVEADRKQSSHSSAMIAKSHGLSFKGCPCRREVLVRRSEPLPCEYVTDCVSSEKFK
jgi:hypothetical protein